MRKKMSFLGKIESLLFVSGEEGLTLDELATLLEQKREKVSYDLLRLKQVYAQNESSGLQLVRINQRYQLVTKPQYAQTIKQYAESPFAQKLSQAALETLAIIAYKQPVTRIAVDEIRGVQSSAMIQKLEHRDLVTIVGRQDSPGRPNLFGVTPYFYQYFGINSIEELPDLAELFSEEEMEADALFQIEANEESEDVE